MKSEAEQPTDNSLTVQEVKLRIVKEFLDLIILFELRNHQKLSGYDLDVVMNKKFGLALSPGTVYATLYSMERRGFVKGIKEGKKTTFSLTVKGEASLENFKVASQDLADFMQTIFPVLFKRSV